jgi:hypothetical protein
MRLIRTVRLDLSDTLVFERAAEPGEWAVAGGFMFLGEDVAGLAGKRRAAFRAGFVGVRSLGFSTLVAVTEASVAEVEAAKAELAASLLRLGAPDRATAERAADEELAFAASLCAHEPGTLIALHRTLEGGEVRERFRVLERREPQAGADRLHGLARAFEFVESDEPEERVDLVGLVGEERR